MTVPKWLTLPSLQKLQPKGKPPKAVLPVKPKAPEQIHYQVSLSVFFCFSELCTHTGLEEKPHCETLIDAWNALPQTAAALTPTTNAHLNDDQKEDQSQTEKDG